MSSTIGSGYGILPTLIANSTSVHQQLDTLTEQASTGLVSQTYAGLGGGEASVSLDLNPQINALQTYQNNISQATGSMQVTQTAMTQIQQIAVHVRRRHPQPERRRFVGGRQHRGPGQRRAAAGRGPAEYAGRQRLCVRRPGHRQSAGPFRRRHPVVGFLHPESTRGHQRSVERRARCHDRREYHRDRQFQRDRHIAVPATSPFSAYMSQPASSISAPVVQTGEGGTVQTGLLASANSVAVSSGTTTTPPTSTGSYMRDLMMSLATLGSMSSSQISDPGFSALVQSVGTSLNGVVNTMAVDVGVLGNTQSNLTTTQTQLSDTATALTGQLSNVQNVDMASTLSQLTAMQTQLQVSYRLISGATSLSLVNFLPTTSA